MKLRNLFHRARRSGGFTMPDVLMAAAVTVTIVGGLLTATVALQKSTAASQHYAECQFQQARVLDYIARDLRRALTVVVDPQAGGERLTLTIPDYYDENDRPRDPSLVGGRVCYGAPGSVVEIAYYRRAGVFYRSVDGAETALTSGVSGFDPHFVDSGKQTVSVTVTFLTRYRFHSVDATTLRAGTAASATVLLRNQRQ